MFTASVVVEVSNYLSQQSTAFKSIILIKCIDFYFDASRLHIGLKKEAHGISLENNMLMAQISRKQTSTRLYGRRHGKEQRLSSWKRPLLHWLR